MEYIIDRFEENIAVCQNVINDEIKNIERGFLPEETKEGDVIVFSDGKYFLDREKTEERKRLIKEKFDSLWG